MCGILCSVNFSSGEPVDDNALNAQLQSLQKANAERGPDSSVWYHTRVEAKDPMHRNVDIACYSSVLHLRGDTVTRQPLVSADGNILCFNGEIFEGLDINEHENDASKLFGLLNASGSDGIAEVLGSVEGCYAFVFYHNSSKRLFFGRDPLGRRSLLLHIPVTSNDSLVITSVGGSDVPQMSFEEVCTDMIMCLDLMTNTRSTNLPSSAFVTPLSEVPRKLESRVFTRIPKLNVTWTETEPQIQTIDDQILPSHALHGLTSQFIRTLEESVRLRVKDIPYQADGNIARVAILFSGGIDCTVIALLADRHVPPSEPIDLLNVAFENPRKLRNQSRTGKVKAGQNSTTQKVVDPYAVPDRESGLEELDELRTLCPGRIWNFVEVNVDFEEAKSAQKKVLSLMYPRQTVMDLSLALALYFASRGKGRVLNPETRQSATYISTARVILSGLGADELLGGYGRHRTAYQIGGWSKVIDELQLDLDRIPTRNLGRDDRVISSHGKETRYPFLSIPFVSFAAGLPVQVKIDPRLPLGCGEKMILRLAAARLGLKLASTRKKRAMQFGSRSARMEGDQKGHLLVDAES
ncbi:hypothetical protein SISSUDRAFT_1024067 [Sistotremastrum suecicum HHB10207 ss-3]|uniref:Glutamine amidotransferase type-2 domain-containing protein n=1 Tax=Sistotremastrum suecicum HHB10207 ss-3 TaxID=1314776 RepID=A0A166BPQ5_9AGAM|nr:hypothetical protein SISSUDRAFT_1024067 [Sistotremastrum suecicum HHB10207 ss-3]